MHWPVCCCAHKSRKAYSLSNLLFFLVGAESLGAVSGAVMIHLSLCLRS